MMPATQEALDALAKAAFEWATVHFVVLPALCSPWGRCDREIIESHITKGFYIWEAVPDTRSRHD